MRLIIVTLFFILPLSSIAQDSLWTLEYCIDKAIENNIRIKKSKLNQENARVNAQQSIAQLLPTVNASANHSYNFGRNINPVTNTFQESNIQGNQFSLYASLAIFNGFQTQSKIRETRANYMAADEGLKQSKTETMLFVTAAYLDVLFYSELVKVAQWQLQNSEAKASQISRFVDAGILPKNQLLETQALLSTDELTLTDAENNLALARLTLLQTMLLPSDTPFELAAQNIEPENTISSENTSQIYSSVADRMPAIRQSRYIIQSARYRAFAAKGTRLPKLFLDAGILSNYAQILGQRNIYSFENQIRNNFGQYVQLRLDVPIFNAWQSRTVIQTAIAENKRAELNATDTENNIRQEIEKAYLNKKVAQKKYIASAKQADAMKENLRMAEQRLAVGSINLLDYTTLKNKLSSADSDFLRAKYDFIFKTKIFDFYKNPG